MDCRPIPLESLPPDILAQFAELSGGEWPSILARINGGIASLIVFPVDGTFTVLQFEPPQLIVILMIGARCREKLDYLLKRAKLLGCSELIFETFIPREKVFSTLEGLNVEHVKSYEVFRIT